VFNEWLDPETGKARLSTEDAAFTILGRPAAPRDGTAPTWLRVPTLSDSVRLVDEKALALSVSAKDRSAILCAGRGGLAVWFDAEKPFFTTSTFYAKELPSFLKPVNERLAQFVLKGAFQWGLPGGGFTGQSPQPLKGRQGDNEPLAEQPQLQPILDTALGLGQDDVPDLLTISFSGHDRIGHGFGAESPEAVAEFLHIDQEVGRLLKALDTVVGKGRYVVAFTSDHGVAPVPDLAQARGLEAGRCDLKRLIEALDAHLDRTLGRQDWFAGGKTPGLTLTPLLRAKALTQLEALKAVARTQPGIADLLGADDLHGPIGALFSHGAFPGRSADLLVVTKPYWTYNAVDRTGHASPYLYDRAVPLIFFGANVKKGRGGQTELIHIAPTLARLLSVPTPPAAQGHALEEVIAF
jgi:Type I phosphodiesterase / nucleotide pyrophosphatase